MGNVREAMANGSTYGFGAAFARLTCILEDATERVLEGQSGLIDETACHRIVIALEQKIASAGGLLKEIRAALK